RALPPHVTATVSLHDALPISSAHTRTSPVSKSKSVSRPARTGGHFDGTETTVDGPIPNPIARCPRKAVLSSNGFCASVSSNGSRSEEHTSELQSGENSVSRLH